MLAEVDRGLTGLRARATSWEPMSAAAWPAATIAAAAVAGAMVGKGEVKFALLPVAALVALLFARLPVAGFVAVLWSVGTAIDMIALPEVGAASLRFEAAEVLLWLALASLVFLPTAARRELISLALRRESLVMALFLGAIVAGVFVGVENGASVRTAALEMRLMLFYAAFWLALVALTSARRLVFTLVATGVVAVVILQIGQVVVGASTRLFLIAPQDVTSSLTDETGFLRVRPPGLTSIYVVAAFSLALLIWGPRRLRPLGWGMTAVTLAGVILSLNRNMLLGLGLGLCAAALVAPQRHRFVVLVAALGIGLSGFVLLAQDSAVQSNAIVSRIASITNYSELQKQTLDDRYYEKRIALQRIHAHPVGGLGWGTDYGARLLSSDDGFLVSRARPFMHEQYLWIWMRTVSSASWRWSGRSPWASGTARAGAERDTERTTRGSERESWWHSSRWRPARTSPST